MQRLFRGSPRATTFLPLLVFLLAISCTLAAFAAPDIQIAGATQGPPGVELDGDAIDDPGDLENEDDWDTITGWSGGVFSAPGGNADISTGLLTDGTGVTIFTTGGSKDILDIPNWMWTDGSVPDKNDIINGGAALYPGNILFFFADRLANNGDAALGFWLLQDAVGLNEDGSFSGQHVVGDLFVVADFVNGGAVAVVPQVYRWVGDGTGSDGNLDLLPGITASEAFAVTNAGDEESPWPYTAKFPGAPVPGAAYSFPFNSFFEGGIDLDALGIDPCFSSFLIETRSSQEPTAQLKDFLLGEFSTIPVCEIMGPPTICDGDEGLAYMTACEPSTGVLYSWQVVEGGTLVGDATGSSITVDSTPGADSIVVRLDVSRDGCVGGPFFYTTLVNDNPVVTVADDEVCAPEAGQLTASVSGGQGPFIYSWSGPGGFVSSAMTINPTVPGTYTVQVTDANGCMGMGSGDLIVNPKPLVEVNDDAVCDGNQGSLTATPSSGTPPYSYAWTGPGGFNATSQTINPTVAGDYCVIVTDAEGCVSDQGCGTLTVNPNPTIQVNNDEVCAGFSGELTATPSGGSAPFTYAWTGPGGFTGNTQTITPSVAGTYNVTVTDADGCVGQGSGTLTVNPNPTVQVNDDEVCEGFDGSLTATPAGGTAPYTYAWTGPEGFNATSQTITPSVAGEYCVVVTDAEGCVSEPGCGTLTVNPNPTVQVNNAEVCEGNSGQLTATPSSGTAPYTYAWTGPGGFNATSQSINVSVAGEYCVVVTDAEGCVSEPGCGTLSVNDNPTVEVNNDEVCAGFSGELCAQLNGGSAPFTYAWTGPGGFTSADSCIAPTVAGTYNVTITDVDGCSGEGSGTLVVNPNPTVQVNDDEVCEGFAGSLTATPAGGTAPYTYAWTGPGGFNATSQTITPSVAGEYCVVVTDAKGCVSEPGCGTLTVNPNPVAQVDDAEVCENFTTQMCVEVSSGTAPYTYAWTGPGGFSSSDSCITVGTAGDYCVVVTDAKGCISEEACGTLTVNPDVTVTVADEEVCEGTQGEMSPVVTGGTDPLIYAWTGPGGFTASTETINPTTPGEYCVQVTDVHGCTGRGCGDYIVNPNPTVQVNDDEVCEGFDGSLTATPAGGTAPYTYAWTGPEGFNATSQTITPSVAGEYCVVVTDAEGCVSDPGCGTLTVNPNPTVQVNDDAVCEGDDGSLTATPSGGMAPYTYAWTGPGGFNATSQTITPSVAGEYCVVVTDAKGCVSEPGCGTLTVNPNPTVQVIGDTICDGETGELCPDITGGTGPYTYAWTGPGGFTSSDSCIAPTADGEYCVVITDVDGCVARGCGDLTVNPNPTCEVTGPTSVLSGQTGVQYCVDVQPAGGTVTYKWSVEGDATIVGSDTGSCIEVNVGAPGTFCVGVEVIRDGCATECMIMVSVGGELFCSYTQGFYGNYGGYKCYNDVQSSTLEILQDVITPASPLVIGKLGTRSFTIEDGNEACIITRLPGGGPADVLPDFGDQVLSGECQTSPPLPLSQKGNWRNILLAQTVALAINVRVDGNLGFAPVCKTLTTQAALPGPDGCLGTPDDVPDPGPDSLSVLDDPKETWEFSDGVLYALDNLGLDRNVYGILELANRALAGMNVGSVSLSEIAGAAANINEGYDECRFLVSCEDPDLQAGIRTELSDFDQQDRDNVGISPVTFALAPNFPNPFQRATTIRFALPEASEVKITVHDVRGRQIAVLVDEYMEAGERSVGFDAADNGNLASGVYFYRMQARSQSGESFTKTMKMLLTP